MVAKHIDWSCMSIDTVELPLILAWLMSSKLGWMLFDFGVLDLCLLSSTRNGACYSFLLMYRVSLQAAATVLCQSYCLYCTAYFPFEIWHPILQTVAGALLAVHGGRSVQYHPAEFSPSYRCP